MVVVFGVVERDGRDGTDVGAEHLKEVDLFLGLCVWGGERVGGSEGKWEREGKCQGEERKKENEETDLVIGHVDDTVVPLCSTHMSESNSGVASCTLDDGPSGLDQAYKHTVRTEQCQRKRETEPTRGGGGGGGGDYNGPLASASLTTQSAARSLTDPPGFWNSALPRMLHPVWSERWRRRI